MASRATLDVAGRPVPVTNLDKVFYPQCGFTKGHVIDYYIRISPWLLPHLAGRPLTLKRYPDGVEGFFFYEKKCPSHRPEWVKTARVSRSDGEEIPYCVMNDLPSLVWAANLADLELHTFLHRAPALQRPTALVFDLDPGAPADFVDCCRVALRLHAIFTGLNLACFAKVSGSKGLQVYVPLNSATTYTRTKSFAHALARQLERETPEKVVSRMAKNLRRGKVLVDWSQNDAKKTTVSVYSLRARAEPRVSAPVTWDEVANAARRSTTLQFDPEQTIQRATDLGDLFAPVLSLKQKLPALTALG